MLEEQLEQKFKVIPVIIQTLGVVNPPPKKKEKTEVGPTASRHNVRRVQNQKKLIYCTREILNNLPPLKSL